MYRVVKANQLTATVKGCLGGAKNLTWNCENRHLCLAIDGSERLSPRRLAAQGILYASIAWLTSSHPSSAEC